MTVVSAPTPAVPPQWWSWALRAGGLLVGVCGGILLGLYGAFLTPLRVAGAIMPVSLLLCVGGNIVLIWFTYTTTQHKGLALVPSLVWVALSFVAASRTTEGDLVLVDSNWVSVVYLLAGSLTIGIAAYRMILPPRR